MQAAAYYSYTSVVKVLLKHRANPFSKGRRYSSPFEAALFIENLEIIQLLYPQRSLISNKREILNHTLEKAKLFRDEEIIKQIIGFLKNKLREIIN